MTTFGVPKEIAAGENRVAMTPDSAAQLQKLGYQCVIESGAGKAAGFEDAAYSAAGVEVIKTAAALWKKADVIGKVRPATWWTAAALVPLHVASPFIAYSDWWRSLAPVIFGPLLLGR